METQTNKEASHPARSKLREHTRLGIFQCSSCSYTADGCLRNLETKINSSVSEKSKYQLKSKQNLLQELICVQYMPLHMAFDEYLGMIPSKHHPNYTIKNKAQKDFVDSLLNANIGLPVIIVNLNNGERYVMLHDACGKETELDKFAIMNEILEKNVPLHADCLKLEKVSSQISAIFQLSITQHERGLLLAMLSLLFSTTALRQIFGMNEDHVHRVCEKVSQYAADYESEQQKVTEEARNSLNKTIMDLENNIDFQHSLIKTNLHEIELINREQDLENAKERLSLLKRNNAKLIKKIAKRELFKWKSSLLSQKGKGVGHFRIDRGAEMALFKVLEEQLTAHERRRGADELEQRIHLKEMRYIANTWLEEHGKKKIKSYETVRSWQVPRRKRSIQAKQHRGKGLFRRRKPQKKYTDAHINLHYNRAHQKSYTRMIFSKNRNSFKKYAVRRAWDDKAFLRCGTSEGFCRPVNKPVMLSDENKRAHLPAYDFAESVGYVTPGVSLIIKDMEEKEVRGKDVFSVSDAVISVTCKPKRNYPSTSTNWANDAYHNRLCYPKEHELEDEKLPIFPLAVTSFLILLKDSFKQYALMTIREDYIMALEGGEHLAREKLRNQILILRILYSFEEVKREERLTEFCTEIHAFLYHIQFLVARLDTDISNSRLSNLYETSKEKALSLHKTLDGMIPKHRPVDVQSTDGGPGVGISEKIVCLRLVESFLINDLDLQARFHYAAYDSKSHVIERVMSTLNDALGDGRFIDIPKHSILQDISEDDLLKMSEKEFKEYKEKKLSETAQECAKRVAARYTGARSMGTTITCTVPDKNNIFNNFFFDHEYMIACKDATKKSSRNCPGNAYYQFLQDQFHKNYIKYDNGIEGIRQTGEFRCPFPVNRVPPPVPDYTTTNEHGVWHYHTPETLPEEYKHTNERNINDFCPRPQLKKYIDNIGSPDLVHEEDENGVVFVRDANDTWRKIQAGLMEFIRTYTGMDLEHVVRKNAEEIYIRSARMELKKISRMIDSKKKIECDALFSITKCTGSEALKYKFRKRQTQQMPKCLAWNGMYEINNSEIEMTNTCSADNFLYFSHVLQTTRKDISKYLQNSNDTTLRHLYEIHKLFEDGNCVEGKYLWFSQFPQFHEGQAVWDAMGTEDEFTYAPLASQTSTTYRNTCTNVECPDRVTLFSARIFTFSMPHDSYVDQHIVQNFQQAITSWMNNAKEKPCRRQLHDGAGRCPGTRKLSPREFIHGLPVFLPVEVVNCPWTKQPDSLLIHNERYTLKYISFGSGGHFCCCILHQGQWWLYDGLKEFNHPGSGLRKVSKPAAPQHYMKNYVVYIRNNVK